MAYSLRIYVPYLKRFIKSMCLSKQSNLSFFPFFLGPLMSLESLTVDWSLFTQQVTATTV